MSPILKTLTETISTDTICSMVLLMMSVHLIFYDYGVQCAIVSPPISLNAAIFGTVCLASRLSSTYQAFTLLIWAVDVFVVFTLIRNKIRVQLTLPQSALFSSAVVAISFLSLTIVVDMIYCCLYALLVVFINFVIPVGFYMLQPLKE